MPDPVCVVLPVHDPARLAASVADWRTALTKLGRPAELVVVDDGCTPPVKLPDVRVLRNEVRQGFGSSLRTAVAATDQPLIATCSLDYPYSSADLAGMLKAIDTPHEVLVGKLTPSLVAGCRGGQPAPVFWRFVGVGYRALARVCCGFKPEKPPGWLGVRGHVHSWLGWVLFANPLADPDSTFRLYRRELFDLFPVQSDGDFVHSELVAKTTFCTRLIDVVPLTPSPAPVPASTWVGWWRVFKQPVFNPVVPPPLPADG